MHNSGSQPEMSSVLQHEQDGCNKGEACNPCQDLGCEDPEGLRVACHDERQERNGCHRKGVRLGTVALTHRIVQDVRQ